MHGILQDLRFAHRTFRKNPGYTAVALVTLALGIGANTAIFSLVHGILLRPLPYPDADRLVRVWEISSDGHVMQGAWRNFTDWRERARSFDDLTAHGSGGTSTVLGTGRPLRVGVTSVSEGFFRTIGVQPAHGRAMLPEEHRLGADPAAVVSDAFWRTQLGADPDLSSRRLGVSGFEVRIVGVMPPGFEYPGDIDIWYPTELNEQTDSRSAHNFVVVGRLKENVSIEAADAELDALTAAFLDEDPGVRNETWFEGFFPREARLMPLQDSLIGDTRRPLLILLGASGLLLLIACTNLASTTLARGTTRERELAVRLSLGAGRGRVIRQLYTESLALSLVGAALGTAFALAVVRSLPALAPDVLPRMDAIGLNAPVLAFTILVALGTAVLFGLLPALRLARTDLARSLHSGAARGGTERARRPIWRWLVASEIALAVVLLVGCGLLIRSFYTVLQVRPGFRTEGVLTATVNPPATKYPDGAARRTYDDELLRQLESMPGVARVGLVARAPLTGISNGDVQVRSSPHESVTIDYQLVSAGYFGALDIPLIRGRLFDERDREDGEHVVVVSETLARAAWPGEDPIGKRINGGGMDDYWDKEKWATVVGVVADVRQRDLTRPPRPTLYFSYRQRPYRSWAMTAMIRSASGSASALAPAVRRAASRIDSDVPVTFSTVEARVSRAVADRRFTMMALGLFAAVAVVLASVGIYGVVAYTVARRTREVGVRVALGADPISVRRLMQRDSLAAAAMGGLIGIGTAAALTRVMQSLLFEVSPTDPLTFVGVLVTVAGVTWLASFVPSLRGTRVDPIEAMRVE